MTATQISPIERLEILSAQQTARTYRLHEATCALLAKLEPHTALGTEVTVDGIALRLQRIRSNVGYSDFWCLDLDGHTVQLERAVDSEGLLHGDFHAALRGSTREHLIAFASRAGRFVSALIAREEQACEALSSAQASVEAAIAEVQS